MSAIVVACLSVALFCAMCMVFRVNSVSLDVLRLSREAFSILADPDLPDSLKEATARKYSGRLLLRFLALTLLSAIAGCVSIGFMALMDLAGVAPMGATTSALSNWLFLIIVFPVCALVRLVILLRQSRLR